MADSSFENHYWKVIYGSGLDVDGSFNSKEHAKYLHSLFSLMGITVGRMADLGFGKGQLLRSMDHVFRPKEIWALDISRMRVNSLQKSKWFRDRNYVSVEEGDLVRCPNKALGKKVYDLVILNSVLQYLPQNEIPTVLAWLASHSRFVYITVPTNMDYMAMKKEFDFDDPYANSYSKESLRAWIGKDFEIVSFNLLQSKKFDPVFREELFRV